MIPSRLDKYLADATALSRNEIERAAEAGRIAVERPGEDLDRDPVLWELVFEEDDILLDGRAVEPSPPEHYVAFNKPAGILTTTSDPHGRACLQPWMRRLPPTIFPVGRLDRATTGLLLLTDDGDLAHVLLRPHFHVEKRYHVRVAGEVTAGDSRLDRLRDGVEIGSGPASAIEARPVASMAGSTVLRLTIDEGRNRVVRRMCRRADLRLEHLHRAAVGPLWLEGVREGDWRILTGGEVDALWQAAGGRDAARARKVEALSEQATRWRDENRPHQRLEAWLEQHADTFLGE